jgi:Flp pilus assembly protein TadB
MALAVILEGLDIGRQTRHRARVDREIVNRIVRVVCRNSSCPQLTEPNASIREAAKALFYQKIDRPSREVAFHHWGWYFFGLFASWQAVIILVIALPLALWFKADAVALRWIALVLLAISILLARLLVKTWERKTLNHAQLQLTQIASSLGQKFAGASCQEPGCPSI